MRKGKRGLIRRNSNYFEDILPQSIEDARTRKMTYKQLKQVNSHKKFLNRKEINFKVSLEIKAREELQERRTVLVRRKSIVQSLRNKRRVNAEVEKLAIKNWKRSISRIKKLRKQKGLMKRNLFNMRCVRQQNISRKFVKTLIEDYTWFEDSRRQQEYGIPYTETKEDMFSKKDIMIKKTTIPKQSEVIQSTVYGDTAADSFDELISMHENSVFDSQSCDHSVLPNVSGNTPGFFGDKKRIIHIAPINRGYSVDKAVTIVEPIKISRPFKIGVSTEVEFKNKCQPDGKTSNIENTSISSLFGDLCLFCSIEQKWRVYFMEDHFAECYLSLPLFKMYLNAEMNEESVGCELLRSGILLSTRESDKISIILEVENMEKTFESSNLPNCFLQRPHREMLKLRSLWVMNKSLFCEDLGFFLSFWGYDHTIDAKNCCICWSFTDSSEKSMIKLEALHHYSLGVIVVSPKEICKYLASHISSEFISLNISLSTKLNLFLSGLKEKISREPNFNVVELLLASTEILEYLNEMLDLKSSSILFYDFAPSTSQQKYLLDICPHTYFAKFEDEAEKSPNEEYLLNTGDEIPSFLREYLLFGTNRGYSFHQFKGFVEHSTSCTESIKRLRVGLESMKAIKALLVAYLEKIYPCCKRYTEKRFKDLLSQVRETNYFKMTVTHTKRLQEIKRNILLLQGIHKETPARDKRISFLIDERIKAETKIRKAKVTCDEIFLLVGLDVYSSLFEEFNYVQEKTVQLGKDAIYKSLNIGCDEMLMQSFVKYVNEFCAKEEKAESVFSEFTCQDQIAMLLEDRALGIDRKESYFQEVGIRSYRKLSLEIENHLHFLEKEFPRQIKEVFSRVRQFVAERFHNIVKSREM